MNILKIRDDFPILKEAIYLDSASTSLTPEPVLNAVLDYYHGYKANIGRGVYRMAQLADQRYRNAHQKVARFISGENGMVVFTRNTTESINIVAQGLEWKSGDKVVTTLLEHHSNLLPWMRLKKEGVKLEVVNPDQQGRICQLDFDKIIDKKTKLVAVSQLSNVLGNVIPVKEISEICRDRGAILLVDGAQSVPHMPLSVVDIDCDILCFSGHKMLGPSGTGVLWLKNAEIIEPLLAGGGMVEDIRDGYYSVKKGFEGFEAGTPNISGGIGLGAAVDYIQRIGIDEIHNHETKLVGKLLDGLLEMDGMEVYGPMETKERGGVVSFNVSNLLPHEVAMMLDQASNIMVRSGHHCCIPLMKHMGLKYGTVRASLYLYNSIEDIDLLLSTLKQIVKMA